MIDWLTGKMAKSRMTPGNLVRDYLQHTLTSQCRIDLPVRVFLEGQRV